LFRDIDHYNVGLVVAALIGAALAVYAYGSYTRGDLAGYSILAVTGAASGIAFWVLYMNDYLGFPKR
jgi:hypothetical protein